MKANFIYLSLFSCGISISVTGQQISHCGSALLDQFNKSADAAYESRRGEIEKSIATLPNDKSSAQMTIPVVFHIIYRLPSQNISDAQVISQIDVLNRDFNKLNWDTLKVPSVWKNLIADCEITFVLANRDPAGQPTNGITRTQTTVQDIAWIGDDAYYTTSKGGHDIWNRDHYLNIWVCEVSQGLFGFASMPGSTAESDGVVIDFTAFGTGGTSTSPTDLGRTATHEIGHFFNLYHTWGNPPCGDDFVSDTPEQEDGNYGCEVFPKVTCSNGPNGDMFMNFMDYSDDDCLNMYTNGQKSRMISSINTSRSSLLSSPGYTGIGELQADGPSVYPNPATDRVVVAFGDMRGFADLQIFSSHGILISETRQHDTSQTLQLPAEKLDNGLYIIRISDRSTSRTVQLMVHH